MARRLWSALAAVLLLISALVAAQAVTATSSAAATMSPGTSIWHPYSDPVYYPFHGYTARMDCVVSNPGCSKGHTDQSMTLQTLKPPYNTAANQKTAGGPGHYLHEPVFAAGAGVVHIGAHNQPTCGPRATGLGNWVWVDHGGGVISRYGHLDQITVKEGQYVTPSTELGTTGNTGEQSTCWTYYLNFQIEHNGLYGQAVPIPVLKGCLSNRAATVPASGRSFNSVAKSSTLPQSGTSCFPKTAGATPGKPIISVSHYGSTGLTARWRTPSTKPNYIQVEAKMYHPSNRSWSQEVRTNINIGSSVPGYKILQGLEKGRKYAVEVSFHARGGWSAWSAWSYLTIG